MYPLYLKLTNNPCLVIGGGTIAERKTRSLLDSGAEITLISPDVTENLQKLINGKVISYQNRLFESGDTTGFFLVIAATNSREVNKIVYRESMANLSLINCVDDPEYCNFYVPAQVKRGQLKIAISTEGQLPMMAGKIRHYFDTLIPENMGDKLEELGELRRQIIAEAGDDKNKKNEMFAELLTPSIDALLEKMSK